VADGDEQVVDGHADGCMNMQKFLVGDLTPRPGALLEQSMEMTNKISRGRGTLGVRSMPDSLDSGYCTNHNRKAAVRVNLGGSWANLCETCREDLVAMLDDPLPSPTSGRPAP
jgi:hypothetical protein